MSLYSTVEAELTYENQEDFNTAIDTLLKGGWINKENIFIDETLDLITEKSTIDRNDKRIHIPYFHYRNLTYILKGLVKDTKGWAIWTSTDGCFEGGVIRDGVETHYDLNEWAKTNADEDAPDIEKEPENYCIWADDIEQLFNETFTDELA